MTEERLKRFFVEGSGYRVKKELRDLVLFSQHSALKDPPFIKLDLISCRNLLIYLQRDLQRQLCSLFHYALKPGGFLFLSSAETVDTASLFRIVDRDARLYAPIAQAEKVAPLLPQLTTDHRERALSDKPFFPEPSRPSDRRTPRRSSTMRPRACWSTAPNTSCICPRTPACSLRPMEGPFSNELTAQVRPELRVDLKLALQRAVRDRPTDADPPDRRRLQRRPPPRLHACDADERR